MTVITGPEKNTITEQNLIIPTSDNLIFYIDINEGGSVARYATLYSAAIYFDTFVVYPTLKNKFKLVNATFTYEYKDYILDRFLINENLITSNITGTINTKSATGRLYKSVDTGSTITGYFVGEVNLDDLTNYKRIESELVISYEVLDVYYNVTIEPVIDKVVERYGIVSNFDNIYKSVESFFPVSKILPERSKIISMQIRNESTLNIINISSINTFLDASNRFAFGGSFTDAGATIPYNIFGSVSTTFSYNFECAGYELLFIKINLVFNTPNRFIKNNIETINVQLNSTDSYISTSIDFPTPNFYKPVHTRVKFDTEDISTIDTDTSIIFRTSNTIEFEYDYWELTNNFKFYNSKTNTDFTLDIDDSTITITLPASVYEEFTVTNLSPIILKFFKSD